MANIYAEQNYLTMSRSKNTVKAPVKTSLPFGKFVPLGLPLDVLPGSTVKCDLANVTRMLTPIAPIMDDISMDVFSWYIPWRVLFSKTKQFFGENDQVAWTLVQNQNLPHLILSAEHLSGIYTTDADTFASGGYLYLVTVDANSAVNGLVDSVFKGSIFDYFGLPFVYPTPKQIAQFAGWFTTNSAHLDTVPFASIQAMPFRGMQAIYNEFMRNENVVDPILDLNYDGNDMTFDLNYIANMYNSRDDYGGLSYRFWFLPSVARWKDLFTSCNPAPQRGPAVSLPIGDTAKLKLGDYYKVGDDPIKIGTNQIGSSTAGTTFILGSYRAGDADAPTVAAQAGNLSLKNGSISSASGTVNYTNLLADLSDVTMATVNQIRYAFCTQRYYEKLARSGARYHEFLKVMFGTRPSDATLQRPQFLGGHHESININQVLQTSETDSTPLGSTGAYSVTGFKTHTFTNSFNEFGIIMNFACLRKQHSYCQGLDKYWTKRDVWDIYNPTFAHIGEVPVEVSEVYFTPQLAASKKVLGYNEAWYEYRSQRSLTTGLLSPTAPNNLASFVLTDVYDTEPALDSKFIEEDPNGLDRVLVAGASYTNQFIADFLFRYTISAVMPVHSTPGLLDHY